MKSTTEGNPKWGARIAKWVAASPMLTYLAVLIFGIVLGFIDGAMIKSWDLLDPIGAEFTFFILFPAYIIADGILNSRFFWCPLRAASLPLAQGFVIWKMSDWGDPFGVSQIVAIIYVFGSLVVVGITHAVRKSKKA